MVVVVVGIVTFAQPQQELQVQYPPIESDMEQNSSNALLLVIPPIQYMNTCI